MGDRLPRTRAAEGKVSRQNEHAEVREIDAIDLTDHKHRLVNSMGPSCWPKSEDDFVHTLESIAISYLGARAQPPAPKALVREKLRQLAQAATAADRENSDLDAHLRIQLQQLPPEALVRLYSVSLELRPTDTSLLTLGQNLPATMDWDFVASACERAAVDGKRGDYPNRTLLYAAAGLIQVFEEQTGKPATLNREPATPSSLSGLAREFFSLVDPALGSITIDNALRQARRQKVRVNL